MTCSHYLSCKLANIHFFYFADAAGTSRHSVWPQPQQKIHWLDSRLIEKIPTFLVKCWWKLHPSVSTCFCARLLTSCISWHVIVEWRLFFPLWAVGEVDDLNVNVSSRWSRWLQYECIAVWRCVFRWTKGPKPNSNLFPLLWLEWSLAAFAVLIAGKKFPDINATPLI